MPVLDIFDLTGRRVLVTGASRGIGAGLAAALGQAGAEVALVARDRAALTTVAAEIEQKTVCIAADLSDPAAAVDVVEQAEQALGPLDVLVNNSAMTVGGPALDATADSWDTVSNLNARAPFLLAQAAARGMIERRSGKIINLGSIVSYVGDSMAPAYVATKTAVLGLTRALAVEWAPFGVTVNALCPGWIETDMTADLQANAKFNERVLRSVPARRWGKPSDLTAAMIFLASPGSDFMTGQSLIVDGGLLARW
jgi:2-deoxy-D-gluconate 3-dehydrogenase